MPAWNVRKIWTWTWTENDFGLMKPRASPENPSAEFEYFLIF